MALPAGDCALSVDSTPERTTLLVDGVAALTRAGDLRPDVVGAFSELATGVAVEIEAQPPVWAAVGASKADSNQARTAGENGASGSAASVAVTGRKFYARCTISYGCSTFRAKWRIVVVVSHFDRDICAGRRSGHGMAREGNGQRCPHSADSRCRWRSSPPASSSTWSTRG